MSNGSSGSARRHVTSAILDRPEEPQSTSGALHPSWEGHSHSWELYREVMAHANDAIAIVDTDGKYLEQNAAHHALIGYTDEELMGQTPAIHLGKEVFAAIAHILATHGTYVGEVQSTDKHGVVRDIELSAFALTDADGQPLCYVGIKREITARKRAERHARFLADATAALASSLDSSHTLQALAALTVAQLADWCIIDLSHGPRQMERVAVARRGPGHQELVQRLYTFPINMRRAPGIASVLRSGVAVRWRGRTDLLASDAFPDGDYRVMLRTIGARSGICAPLTSRDKIFGTLTLLSTEPGRRFGPEDLALVEELGQRAGIAIENAELYSEMLKANQAKDEILGLVSHELRTPLTVIYDGSRLLRNDRISQTDRDAVLAGIEEESERLYRVVENFVILARLDAGMQINTQPVSLADTLPRVAEPMLAAAHHPPAKLHLHPHSRVMADPLYLEHVLRNLLSNAIKYSPTGSPIELRAQPGNFGEVVVTVADRGVGVKVDETERIFERFYRSIHTTRTTKGIGIGLSVCKRLVQAHGGRIWAECRPGGGLAVSFTLPAADEQPARRQALRHQTV